MKIENIRFIKTKYLLKHLETRRPKVCISNVVAWLSTSMLIVVGSYRCCSCHTVAIAIDMTRITWFFIKQFTLVWEGDFPKIQSWTWLILIKPLILRMTLHWALTVHILASKLTHLNTIFSLRYQNYIYIYFIPA